MARGPAIRFAVACMLCAWAGTVTPRIAWSAADDGLIRCESSARETVRCKADTRSGVTLQRQLSRAGCWYDETWGYDAKAIWVSNGCRADFALGRTPVVGAPSGASDSSAPSGGSGISGTDVAMGAAAVLVVGAIAAAVLSNRGGDNDDDDHCRHRDRRGRCQDDDYDDDYGSNDPWRRDQRVRCESQGHKERYCRVDTRRGVELYRQLSEARCRYGSTWGYDRKGIWVDRGCRAEFVIRG
jgi:Protein of unknown function (DUF3011)